MTPEHKDFLLAEFKAAWDTVNSIDNRRGAFASFYTAIFIGTVTVFFSVVKSGPIEPQTRLGLTLILIIALLAGAMIVGLLLSEREANKRYRRKINLIRTIFLGDATAKEIVEYLKRKDLGIVLSDHRLDEVGKTLRLIFGFVGLQFVIIFAALWWLWAQSSN